MTISQNLLFAILSMDAYNRGYNAGVTITGDQIGNAAIGSSSSILLDSNNQPLDQPASFFAQAYTIGDRLIAGLTQGQTIISYRGTDPINLVQFLADLWIGYGIALGSPFGEQA